MKKIISSTIAFVLLLALSPLQAETLEEITSKAEQGDARAQDQLGEIYDYGEDGVEEDDVQAIHWYRKAADQGDAKAQ
jgi:TPR repeat protein